MDDLAAQPLVLDSYINPLYTIETNTMGTANVLEGFRLSNSAELLILITTDKVYENLNNRNKFRETDRLGGNDPYSASKASSELLAYSYFKSYFSHDSNKKIATVRAGNVIGGGDWSENRIVPDCIKSLEKNEKIIIRNPTYTRPWQFVLEPIGGYLLLAQKILSEGKRFDGSWNFGPLDDSNISVEDLVKGIIKSYGRGNYVIKNELSSFQESKFLALDITKAMKELKWKPCLNINEALEFTVDWYKNYRDTDVFEFCNRQIEAYEKKWKLKNSN